jgi:IPT/TIG domain
MRATIRQIKIVTFSWLLVAAGVVTGVTTEAPAAAITTAASALVPLSPARLLDSRPSDTIDGKFANFGKLGANQAVELEVVGRGGVPADASAVTLNLTVVDPEAAGFVTAFPCGGAKPNTSNVNFAVRQTVANLSIIKLGARGKICLTSDAATHLIADVTAYSPAGASLSAITPARVFDSRPATTADGQNQNVGKLSANQIVELLVAGRVGVPTDASAVALNITITDPAADGFATAYPCGAAKPNASNVNFRAGQTVANLTLLKVGTNGKICITSTTATHLVVDVSAFAPSTTLLGTLTPSRLLESRQSPTIDGQYQNIGKLAANQTVELQVSGRTGIPNGDGVAALNITVTDPAAPGFITAYPCGTTKPNTSSLNFTTGQTVANLSVIALGTNGKICLTTSAPTHLIADVTAYDIRPSAIITPADAPIVLYTDIASGPNSGGENNKGTYLSIFGKNFGNSLANVRVLINNAEVDNYRFIGASRGRPDIQQLTVQLGAVGNPTPGTPLPLKVVVNGKSSNQDKTFTVNPGRILFASTNGNDGTAIPGDITKPYRHVQLPDLYATQGAWGQVSAGDTIVMRAGTWADTGFEQYFIRFMKADRSSGTAPTGALGSGPITLMGYPGEDVFINGDSATHPLGAVSGLNGDNYPNAGKWINITNVRIEGGGYDGPISLEIKGDNWRVVNTELTAFTGVTSGPSPSRMGGIAGDGLNAVWLGNHIHDIWGSAGEAHGIYIGNEGSYDIGYNLINDIKSGNGIQTFSRAYLINNVTIHHNIIHDVSKHLINLAQGSGTNIRVFNNLAYNAAAYGVRFNDAALNGCRVWNNTFYNTGTSNPDYPLFGNDDTPAANAIDIRNNIVVPTRGQPYLGGNFGFGSDTTFANNIWFGGSGSTSFDSQAINANPLFVAAGSDFHLQAGSPAIDSGSGVVAALVTNDLDITTSRPQGAGIDRGAYERLASA